ncbi:2-phosphosulfolactate phosphatase [Haloferax gibbonsii]|uniref:2-phosphosulfolactate phosphatase n=1 Tax=Haloferax gibbonsii TaxID=35746 RepID=A0A0K1IY66_HALGI|nr:2-phosphosulfolactate phosphatase [Haloferax gibbonsii]AKU09394.1 2-phosphosulfolactate phosphatase [Haloferax gibbonsii]
MSADGRQTAVFAETLIEGCENIPAEPAPGDYVVVDVTHFSATVAELLALGAEYVHVTDERGDEPAYREDHPECLIGGGKTDDYEPNPGYDFFNSPSYVQRLDLAGRPTAMTSTNGGRAVSTLRERGGPGVEVFVGGYTNAAAVADLLEDRGRPITIVASGSSGQPTPDDTLGAALIDDYLHGDGLTDRDRERYARLLVTAKGPRYEQKHEIRRRDLHEFETAIDSRSVVPVLRGDRLVPASQVDV